MQRTRRHITYALVNAAVLIPVKDFAKAKGRLAGVFTAEQRAGLARWTADRVVAAGAPLPVFIACDSIIVAEWAESVGATVLWRPAVGLNPAVADGVATLEDAGFAHIIIAHSDLPLANGLAGLIVAQSVVLVPDLRDDGTNVMVLPSGSGLVPDYGSQSFGRHLAQARALEMPVEIVRDPANGLDIDTPIDLLHPLIAKVLPSWLQTIQPQTTQLQTTQLQTNQGSPPLATGHDRGAAT